MASVEMQLLSRLIQRGELSSILEWGITLDDFVTNEAKAMFNSVLGYFTAIETRGSILGPNLLREKYPNFELCDDAGETTDGLCFEVRKKRLRHLAKEAGQALIEGADSDPVGALSLIHSKATQMLALGYSKQVDVDFAASYKDILEDYQDAKDGKMKTVKMPWPWPTLENETGGVQEEDYIVFYGRPKSMKSWVLSKLIAHCFEMNRRAVLYTKEMTPKNLFKRIAACIIGLPYSEFRRGKLPEDQEHRMYEFQDVMDELQNSKRLIALSAKDVAVGADTVSWFQSKVEKYGPDVSFIDGLYLMSDPASKKGQDWNRVMNISRDIRQSILTTKVPVIATMQANRKAAGHSNAELDEIAFSDAIGQDVTMAARVINEKHEPTIALVLGGSREFQLHGLRIHGVPATNFSEHSQMTEKDIHKAKTQDAKIDEPDAAGAHAKAATGKKKAKGVDGEFIDNALADM